jgi:hypothetical protein
MISIKRVPYGKDSTPKHLREYKCVNISGSPVGTLDDWRDFAVKQESALLVSDKEKIWVELLNDDATVKKTQTLEEYNL